MSDTSYNVVFEYTPEFGGSAFFRTFIDFHNQENFDSNYEPTSREKVIAQGISENEATNLCYLTPIITYYTHAVEEIFKHGEPKEWFLANYFLEVADYGNIDTQKERQRLWLRYFVPEGLEAHLASLCLGETKKARFMKAFIDAYVVSVDRLYAPLAKQNLRKIEPKLFLDLD